MNNEKIMVTRSTLPDYDEYCGMLKRIWNDHWLTNNGEYHEALANELESFLDVENITLFTNGHLALESALQSLHLSGEVITTPFTFASTTHAIVRSGLVPVFCDINETDYTIDVDKIESLITNKTCAIVPVHVYGNICDVDRINEIAKKYNLKVIYDAAHAFAIKKNGVDIANFGDISMFSFHATKVFNTIEGGALAYNNTEYKQAINLSKNFGIANAESIQSVGGNAKMNEFQAAMGLCNLKHINESIQMRKHIVEKYRECLSVIKGIHFLKEFEGIQSNYAYFPILVDEAVYGRNRDELADYLQKENVYVRKYFYPLVNAFECYSTNYNVEDTPIAKRISEQVITLPLYSDLAISDCEKICSLIQEGSIHE